MGITAVTTLVVALDSLGLALVASLVDLVLGNPIEQDAAALGWAWRLFGYAGIAQAAASVAIVIIAAQALRAAGLTLQQWLTARLRARFEASLKAEAFSAISGAFWSYFLLRRSGDLSNTLTVEASRRSQAVGGLSDLTAAIGNAPHEARGGWQAQGNLPALIFNRICQGRVPLYGLQRAESQAVEFFA